MRVEMTLRPMATGVPSAAAWELRMWSTVAAFGTAGAAPTSHGGGVCHEDSAEIHLNVLNSSYDRMYLCARSAEMGT
jgi:hypothetical protein